MAKDLNGVHPGTLREDAVRRLVEWGFSDEEIATGLGHSEEWVRAVHTAGRGATPAKSDVTPDPFGYGYTGE